MRHTLRILNGESKVNDWFKNTRETPKIWRHDAYTLLQLKKAVLAAVSSLERAFDARNVLDFGAGTAPYKKIFINHGFRYATSDIEGDHDYLVVPGEELPCEPAVFDVVVSFQVLEHVWDLDWYFSAARRVLKKDGKLMLSTHGVWLYHPHPTDFRRWTRDGLINEIESRGFVVEKVFPVVGPLAWTTQFRLLAYNFVFQKISVFFRPLVLFFNMFSYFRMLFEDRITPSDVTEKNASTYLVIARKAEDAV